MHITVAPWDWFLYWIADTDSPGAGRTVLRVRTYLNGTEHALEVLVAEMPRPGEPLAWQIVAREGTPTFDHLRDTNPAAFANAKASLTVCFAVTTWRAIATILGREDFVPRAAITGALLVDDDQLQPQG
jgi:hypothetical protein